MSGSWAAIVAWGLLALAVAALVASQSDPACRRQAVGWAFVGMLACLVKIALLQHAPQWLDVPWDAQKYQANAEALHLHWLGYAVDPEIYDLTGYSAGWNNLHGPLWKADAPITYTGVFGTYEWLYAAYGALWQFVAQDWVEWTIWSHAALAGIFPAGAFLLSRFLGTSQGAARLAALLVVLDPLTGTNAAWLLKDTLVAFLAVLALLAAARLKEHPRWTGAALLGIALGLLAGGRLVAYLAIVIGLVVLVVGLYRSGRRASVATLATGLILSLPILLILNVVPVQFSPSMAGKAVIQRIGAQTQTLRAQKGDEGSDAVVIDWRERLANDPLRAVATSVSRTLFAPYPWVMAKEGLTGSNHIELYYPGTIFWIVCLPLTAVGLLAGARRMAPESLWMLALLAALWLAYTVFLGEWSTRQRVFMIPVFFAFAALGFDTLRRRARAAAPKAGAIRDRRHEGKA